MREISQENTAPRQGKGKHKLVQGIGINDLSTPINEYRYYTERGERKREVLWVCKIYVTWKGMLARCYCPKTQDRQPTYRNCSVCEEWLLFSNFREWVVSQDWEGKALDKDILIKNNKVYSPESCVLIDRLVNSFITENCTRRGDCLIGATRREYSDKVTKYEATCRNPITKDKDYLGGFDTELEAHLSWRQRKSEMVDLLKRNGYLPDHLVYSALKIRYSATGDYYDFK